MLLPLHHLSYFYLPNIELNHEAEDVPKITNLIFLPTLLLGSRLKSNLSDNLACSPAKSIFYKIVLYIAIGLSIVFEGYKL